MYLARMITMSNYIQIETLIHEVRVVNGKFVTLVDLERQKFWICPFLVSNTGDMIGRTGDDRGKLYG